MLLGEQVALMSYRQSVVLTITHSDIFGSAAKPNDQIVSELRAYNRYAIINICAKISLLLNAESVDSVEIQANIAKGLLPDNHWNRVVTLEKKYRENRKNPSITLFHYVPVMMLLKLNLEHNDADGKQISDAVDRELIASWLLSLTEQVSQGQEVTSLERRPFQYRKEALRRFFARQFLLNAEADPLINLVGRSEAVLGFVKADARLDCEHIFNDATGLTIDEYQQLLFMMLTGWKVMDKKKSLDEITVRSIDQYFKHTDIPREKIEKFVELLSFDAADYPGLQAAYSTDAKVDPKSPTNFICFIHKPLMKYGDNFMCMSPNFLALKLTEGVYRVIESQVKNNDSKYGKLAQMWGDAFEKYVHDRLRQMLGPKYHPNPRGERDAESLDGLADLKRTVLLLEYKYAHWSYAARFTGDRTEMKKFLEKLIRHRPRFERRKGKNVAKKKGLGQIRHYLDMATQGSITSPVDLAGKRLLPIVISGEELPFDPLNRMYIEGFAASQECHIKHPGAMPFLVLSCEEIEILQAVVDEKGTDFLEKVLVGYSDLFKPTRVRAKGLSDRATSLRNELLHAGLQVPNSQFMRSQANDLYSRLKLHFKNNKKKHKD